MLDRVLRTKEATVLRITRSTKDETAWLKLEGKLAGPWVDECRASYHEAVTSGERPILDLSEVTFVDHRGLELLRQLVADGVRIPLRSNFVAELLRLEQS